MRGAHELIQYLKSKNIQIVILAVFHDGPAMQNLELTGFANYLHHKMTFNSGLVGGNDVFNPKA